MSLFTFLLSSIPAAASLYSRDPASNEDPRLGLPFFGGPTVQGLPFGMFGPANNPPIGPGSVQYTDGSNWAHLPGQAYQVPTSPQASGLAGNGGYMQPCKPLCPVGLFCSKCNSGLTPVSGSSPLPASYGSVHGQQLNRRSCTCQPMYLGASAPTPSDPKSSQTPVTDETDDGMDKFFPFDTCEAEKKTFVEKVQADPTKFSDCFAKCPPPAKDASKGTQATDAVSCEVKCLEQYGMTSKCATCTEKRAYCFSDYYGHKKDCLQHRSDNQLIQCAIGALQSCTPAFLDCVDGAKIGGCGTKMVSCAYEGQCKEECSLNDMLQNFLKSDAQAIKAQGPACKACVEKKCKPGYNTCVGATTGKTPTASTNQQGPKLGLPFFGGPTASGLPFGMFGPANNPPIGPGSVQYTDNDNWAHLPMNGLEVPTSPMAGGFLTHGGNDQPCRWCPVGQLFGCSKCDYGFSPVYQNTALPDAYGSIHGENFEARECTCQPRWYLGGEDGLNRRMERLQQQTAPAAVEEEAAL